jgi:hypothetical protein
MDEKTGINPIIEFKSNNNVEENKDEGKGVINNLPKPFVKQGQSVNNTKSPRNKDINPNKKKSNTNINNKNVSDDVYRKFLMAAKKGDRDLFLELLEL